MTKQQSHSLPSEDLVAPCGMNCALCISYQAMIHDLSHKGFSKKSCPGCIARGKGCLFMADQCELVGKGKLRFCYQCNRFPCARLRTLDKRYRAKYHMSMIDNLTNIRDKGMEEFLETELEKWQCQKCGGLICCHNGLCLNCELEILKVNKKYHWGTS